MVQNQCIAFTTRNNQCSNIALKNNNYCELHNSLLNNSNKKIFTSKFKSFLKYNIIKIIGQQYKHKFKYKDIRFLYKQKKRLTDNNTKCGICNIILKHKNKHIDHIIPISKYGLDIQENKLLLCSSCNNKKSNFGLDYIKHLIYISPLNRNEKKQKLYGFKNIFKFKKKLRLPLKYRKEIKLNINNLIDKIINIITDYIIIN